MKYMKITFWREGEEESKGWESSINHVRDV